jgi:hypothetical protein
MCTVFNVYQHAIGPISGPHQPHICRRRPVGNFRRAGISAERKITTKNGEIGAGDTSTVALTAQVTSRLMRRSKMAYSIT